MPKTKKLSLKRLEQLHPIEREKELRKLLLNNTNKKFLKIITEEIEKAELEQEHLEELIKEPRKIEEKPSELDALVKKEIENIEEEKKEKIKIGKLYGVKLEENHGKYQTYTPYEAHKEEFKIEITSTSQNPLKTNLNSTEENIKKTTELYMKNKKEEHKH